MINVQIIDNTDQIKSALSDTEGDISFYSDAVHALNVIEKEQPSVILLNYALCKEETADYIKLILTISLDSKIVVIADELSEKEIVNCLIAGARGYQKMQQLDVYDNKLIKVVDAGEAWISRSMVMTHLESLINKQGFWGFSRRKGLEDGQANEKLLN